MEFKIAVLGDQMYGDRSVLVEAGGKGEVGLANPKGVVGFYDHELNTLLKGDNDKPLSHPLSIKY